MIHLDTNFLIHALVPGSPADGKLRQWLAQDVGLAMSAIAWAEFLCGPVTPHQIELAARVIQERPVFSAEVAPLAAELFNLGGRRRGSLADCMIAATALRHQAALATDNPADFERFSGLGLTIAAA